MNRRRLLRDCGAGLSALSVAALSGCNALAGDSNETADGDGDQPSGRSPDGSGTGDGADDATSDPSTGTSKPGDGTGGGTDEPPAVRSTVDGLAVEDTTKTDDSDQFGVTVTLENTGEQATDLFDYGYDLTAFDGSGADVTGDETGYGSTGDTQVDPGEKGEMTVRIDVDGGVDSVARYELVVSCSGPLVEGVYCEG